MYSRRKFLAATLTTAVGTALVPHRGTTLAAENQPLSSRPIPSSGEMLPVIGAGTSGSYVAEIGSSKYDQLKEAVEVFFEGGATAFDTSPNYAGADAVLGQLLHDGGWRDRCFLATKIAADSLPAAQSQWAQSLRDLHSDRVELLQVHNLRAWRIQLPYARELKEQGKTKYVGITHYTDGGLQEMERILRNEPLDFIQIHYSVNARAAADTVLPLARDKGVAVMINRAFEDGRLFSRVQGKALPGWAADAGITSWAQMFLKFALSHPAVTVVIPATSRPDRQADNLRAGHGPLLNEKQQRELVQLLG